MSERRPEGRENRSVMLSFRVTPGGQKFIDKQRGTWTRGEFIRQALAAAQREGLHGPTEKPGTAT